MIPGGWELVAILAVLVLLFGATKLPNAARSIGQSMRIFKAETKGMRGEDSGNEAGKGEQSAPDQQQAQQQALPPAGPQVTPPLEHPRRNTDTTR
ncbi:MAG: Sec-independent protein translocase subunit TatA [Pseudonocardiaceae bacterium]